MMSNTCDVFDDKDYMQILYAIVMGVIGVTSFYSVIVPLVTISFWTMIRWIIGVVLVLGLLYFTFECHQKILWRMTLIVSLSLIIAIGYTALMRYSAFTTIDMMFGIAVAFTFLAVPAALFDLVRG